METMIDTLTIIHVITSVLLIIFVLLHFGKGAEAGLFSGGEGAIMTSGQSKNILTRVTSVLAIFFLCLSVALATLRSKAGDESIFDKDAKPVAPILDESLLDQTNSNKLNDQAKDQATPMNKRDQVDKTKKPDTKSDN